jgi:hypothetical protein
MSRQRTFLLLPVIVAIYCTAIAIIVPEQFESGGWFLLFVPPSIVLTIITLVFLAFTFAPSKIATIALCVSRFPRIAAASMTAGCGYLTAWLIHGMQTASNASLECLPGVLLLAIAWFIFYRYPYEIPEN